MDQKGEPIRNLADFDYRLLQPAQKKKRLRVKMKETWGKARARKRGTLPNRLVRQKGFVAGRQSPKRGRGEPSLGLVSFGG